MCQYRQADGVLVAFATPARSLAKTVISTVGELDFETIFNDGNLLYSPMAYILFIIFVILMPILFSNLLVSPTSCMQAITCVNNIIIKTIVTHVYRFTLFPIAVLIVYITFLPKGLSSTQKSIMSSYMHACGIHSQNGN